MDAQLSRPGTDRRAKGEDNVNEVSVALPSSSVVYFVRAKEAASNDWTRVTDEENLARFKAASDQFDLEMFFTIPVDDVSRAPIGVVHAAVVALERVERRRATVERRANDRHPDTDLEWEGEFGFLAMKAAVNDLTSVIERTEAASLKFAQVRTSDVVQTLKYVKYLMDLAGKAQAGIPAGAELPDTEPLAGQDWKAPATPSPAKVDLSKLQRIVIDAAAILREAKCPGTARQLEEEVAALADVQSLLVSAAAAQEPTIHDRVDALRNAALDLLEFKGDASAKLEIAGEPPLFVLVGHPGGIAKLAAPVAAQAAVPEGEWASFEAWWPTVGQTIGKVTAWEAWQARARLAAPEVPPAESAAEQSQHAPFPERNPNLPAEQQGLFRKFDVRRVDGSDRPGGKHHGCRYYVLDLNHDQHAPAAMRAYAAACRSTHPNLAADIEVKFGASPAEPAPIQTSDELVEVAAEAIYKLLPPCQGCDATTHPWQPGGNSMKQDEARRYARAALEAAHLSKPIQTSALTKKRIWEIAKQAIPNICIGAIETFAFAIEREVLARDSITIHRDGMENNRHYRERVFNQIVELDAKEGLARFARLSKPTTEGTAAEAVAYAVVSPKGGIHKLAIKRDSAERKLAAWLEEWPNNTPSIRPLVFGDAQAQPPAGRDAIRDQALAEIVEEIHRRAEKEGFDDCHCDFTVTVGAEQYLALSASPSGKYEEEGGSHA